MQDFTDNLIQDYSNIRNNYLELNIPSWRLNFLAQNQWRYYDQQSGRVAYPGKLSKEEWEEALQKFIAAGKQVRVEPEAEIIYNLPKSYVIWLEFYDSTGAKCKIDVLIGKTDSHGQSNGTRKIDPRCPKVATVRKAIINESLSVEELAQLADIVSTRPTKGDMSSIEKKIQYKLNGSVIEDVFKDSAEDLGIKVDELDPYNEYFYKGSPGNLADFDVHFKDGTIRVDIKLIGSEDTSIVEADAHDAQFLVCWDWRDQEFITKQVNQSNIDITTIPIYNSIIEAAAQKLKNGYGPLININSINLNTGKIEYTIFK